MKVKVKLQLNGLGKYVCLMTGSDLLYKDTGGKNNCKNYRGIALLVRLDCN